MDEAARGQRGVSAAARQHAGQHAGPCRGSAREAGSHRDLLFQEATSNDITDLADRLAGNLEFELARQESLGDQRYERGVLAVIGLLALFWIAARRCSSAPAAARQRPRLKSSGEAPGGRRGVGGRHRGLRARCTPMALQGRSSAPYRSETIDRELAAAAVSASPAGLSAETAMLYRIPRRTGRRQRRRRGRTSSPTRVDYLRQTHQKNSRRVAGQRGHRGAGRTAPTSTRKSKQVSAIANHVRREVNGIADLARKARVVLRPCPTATWTATWSTSTPASKRWLRPPGRKTPRRSRNGSATYPKSSPRRPRSGSCWRRFMENSVCAVESAGGQEGPPSR